MFNSLRLFIVVTTEILIDVFADVTTDITMEAIVSRLRYYFRGLNIN